MAPKPKITLSKDVYTTLSRLLEEVPEDIITDQLVDELERAKLVAPEKLPDDVVTLHSTVTFTVQSTGKSFTYTLVYPTELDDTSRKLSILSPVGSAIIGLKRGQEIDWPISNTKRTTIAVDRVQPPQ
ncbi:nucleoside diphosphate kinase regulator [Marinimicrobium locisalis]|uniref:nucleoside diphosphate kinase regulator n=1 Tax=Marinimicrobium locisalis TaxID=546022 RepID=UPI00322139B4